MVKKKNMNKLTYEDLIAYYNAKDSEPNQAWIVAKDVANLTELETEEFALELKTILTESQLEIIKEKL